MNLTKSKMLKMQCTIRMHIYLENAAFIILVSVVLQSMLEHANMYDRWYYIKKYANNRVFNVQEWKYFSRSISFLCSILEPPPIVCTKFRELKRAHITREENIIFVMLYLWVKRRRFLDGYFGSVCSLNRVNAPLTLKENGTLLYAFSLKIHSC